jgi:hypothetical protein
MRIDAPSGSALDRVHEHRLAEAELPRDRGLPAVGARRGEHDAELVAVAPVRVGEHAHHVDLIRSHAGERDGRMRRHSFA